MSSGIDEDGFNDTEIPVGVRIELHPATDLWMMGAKFGVVRQRLNGGRLYKVKMDHPGISMLRIFSANDLRRENYKKRG